MSDWRQSDSGKKKPAQPKLKSPKPVGAAPAAPKPTGGWRGKGGAKGAASAPLTTSGGGTRSWTGAAPNTEAASGALVRKWLIVLSLFGAVCFLTVFFVRKALWQPVKLPLFVFSIGEHSSSPELLENPFGNYQRGELMQINQSNIGASEAVQYDNDNALTELNSDKWIERFESIKSNSLAGGGPSAKFVAFYISAYAAFTLDDHLVIYPQSQSPFNDTGGLKLEDALASLASRIDKNSFAWVVLDLQLPTVISNLGDLDPQWRTATEYALSRVDEELRKRLLITLPCDNGEQNWLAPEYSSSIFGHYYRQLLEGRLASTTTLNPDLTVGQFREYLHDRVASEASIRRYASQNTVWLPAENLDRAAPLRLITIGKQQAEIQPRIAIEQSQFSTIKDLWEKVGRDCFQAYRWDPLGYAKIESQLLALEEVALNRPSSFHAARTLIDKAIEELQIPEVELNVSLAEDAARYEFIRGKSRLAAITPLAQKFSATLSAGATSDQLPSFWKAAVASDAAPENPTPAPEDVLAPAEKPYLVWQFYLECVKSNNVQVWDAAFEPKRLQDAINYAQDSTWLEINLLQRLASDIDWAIDTPNRSQGCAKAIALFDRIQRLATHPEPEVSWWLSNNQNGLAETEARFLRGIDYLLANETAKAIGLFDQVAPELAALEETTSKVAQTIATTQEALHLTPHLLSWLLKEYQFASEPDKLVVQTHLQSLGQMAQHSSEIYAYLMRPPGSRIDEGLLVTSNALQSKLSTLKQAFVDYVDSKTGWKETGAASINSQTFRRGRIALSNPLLPLAARERLHTNSVEFLKVKLDVSPDATTKLTPPQRPSKLAADEFFLKQIDANRDRWASIAKSDSRLSLVSLFGEQIVPSFNNAVELRKHLMELEYWHRAGASVYGHFPSLHNRLAVRGDNLQGVRWPWSCPWQRWSLSAANDRVFQVQRLSAAKWGNGAYSGRSLPEDFYFFQRAAKTQLPRGFSLLEPANQLSSGFETTMRTSMNAAATALISLRAQFGTPYPTQTVPFVGTVRAPLMVAGESLDAVAQVYLGSVSARLPWLPSNPTERTWVVDIRQAASERTTTENFDAVHWSKARPPMGTLLLRGNSRSELVDWTREEGRKRKIELTLVKDPADGAIVRVRPPDQPPPITVLLLIDCSKSMDTEVDYRVEAGQPPKRGPLFDLVKNNVIGVLEKLVEIHDTREARVSVGLMPFGLNQQDAKETNLKKTIRLNKNFHAPVTKQLDGAWRSNLEESVNELKASGDTPLYNAIVLASEQAKPDENAFIFVFSDGVNYISDASATAKSDSNVRDAIQSNAKLRLSIFHFDYFKQEWIVKQAPAVRERWEGIFNDGKAELEALRSLGDKQYGYYRSDQANRLMQDALDRIPRSMVRITSTSTSAEPFDSGSKPLGENIHIPQGSLPATLQVSVTGNGNFDEANIEVEALGGEQLLLPMDSRGRFVLEPFVTGGKLQCSQPVGDSLQSRLYVRTFADRVDSKNELGFELHFWNGSQTNFTPRPRLVVAEVAKSNEPNAATFVLADHRFTPATLYPEARVSDVPWPSSKQPVRLRVWAADTLPTLLKQKSIAPDQVDTEKFSAASVSYAHKGDRLVVQVEYSAPPIAEERVVAICPAYDSASRKFDRDANTETHEFLLPENLRDQSVQLQLTTIGDLEEGAQAGEVTQCNFEQIDLRL
jgi:hypothetical protein